VSKRTIGWAIRWYMADGTPCPPGDNAYLGPKDWQGKRHLFSTKEEALSKVAHCFRWVPGDSGWKVLRVVRRENPLPVILGVAKGPIAQGSIVTLDMLILQAPAFVALT
jgi:hypothetical protein